ncbi:AraC family transcriptional regulator [Antarcticibacterium sp. 1MA-6-2]|uniref:AraC family transcriptional regulator n=1 Tax=Antarcticibacterium sp. 1MA-6-2 TaxID=2908210 RepID=UPI001F4559FD|nr:AraC family transcriptional regulator [Antarcticibacterium sp. 1MA-6-2]UJH90010.1 AraC family transcriptional regulator [Antarcticibacterium sp. 1MA-6-2]
MKTKEENIAGRFVDETKIEDGFYILKFQNDTQDPQFSSRAIDSSYIQFHFSVKGRSKFLYNNGSYSVPLEEDRSLLLYNPKQDLPLNVELKLASWLISLVVSIEKFHSLFSQEAKYIPFLSLESKDKKYYQDGNISPSMAIVLNQLMNFNLMPTIKSLYFKAKAYELLSLQFNRTGDADVEQCPFLSDEENILKIRKAKDIVINRMAEPPGLQELSEEIGLSLKKLKEGFKQIYGDSVYSFLFDYKMEYARQLLDSGEYNVNEVGLKVGYSTSSHFIASFRKKFGTTPKKYIMSLHPTT